MLAYEPYEAFGSYGLFGIKIRVGKFFKKPLKSITKMVKETVKNPIKAVKKYPLIGAAIAAGAGYAAHAAGLTSYLAPIKAKLVTAKWALKAKLAPFTSRVGAFVRHRIMGVGAQRIVGKLAKRAVKKPALPPPPSLSKTAMPKPKDTGFLSQIWNTAKQTLADSAKVALQASLARQLRKAGVRPATATPTITARLPEATLPAQPMPAQAPVRAGMFGIPKNMLPLLLIGGVGLLAVLLLSRGGGAPAYIPMPMPMYR